MKGSPFEVLTARKSLSSTVNILRIPRRSTELDLFLIDRGRRGWFRSLPVKRCRYSSQKYEPPNERLGQHRYMHVTGPSLLNDTLWRHRDVLRALPSAVSQTAGGLFRTIAAVFLGGSNRRRQFQVRLVRMRRRPWGNVCMRAASLAVRSSESIRI